MLNDIQTVCFPYCLRQGRDGRYVLLNRQYKPLGFCTRKKVAYLKYPIILRIKGLTQEKIQRLSCYADPNPIWIQLYDDASAPTRNAENMRAYLDRLAILAKLKVEEPPELELAEQPPGRPHS